LTPPNSTKALLCSAIVRPLGPELALLPLAAPVAVCEAVESLAPLECAIKWPNDVWVAERKLGGILIEARPPDWAVIGIGLNATIADHEFPGDLRWPATSIGAEADLDALRDAISAALGEWATSSQPAVIDAFGGRDALAGRRVRWSGAGLGSGSGRATGVDGRGNLLVEPDDGGDPLSLGSGEVSLVLG
jgi:BirA family biotin operon repressor/biotin-[acetyl-CoA-carboxylase] ligase